MTTAPLTHTDTLQLDYLAALWAAGEDLPPDARDELMNTVAGYIALRRDLTGDPAAVLGRLGPPEQLVAAVLRSGTPTHLRIPPATPAGQAAPVGATPGQGTGPAGGAEHAAVALLLVGAFVLPVLSPAAGMLLAGGSPRWTPAQKTAGWLLTGGSAVGALVGVGMLAGVPLFSGLGLVLLYLATCAGSVAAGLTLVAVRRSPLR